MKIMIRFLLFFMILSGAMGCKVYANEEFMDDPLEEILYKFDKVNENGEVIYDKKSPITVDGKKIKLKKIYDSDKEMFRGAWIATISNINFPSRRDMNFNELKDEFDSMLNRAKELNLNAIFFQVSPELDAFYESSFRPWSKYLSGEQGKAPSYVNEGKDFLKYAISETRKRGIEFHAWFNPYRVTKDPIINSTKEDILQTLYENNFARINKDLVYLFQGKLFLDPGRYEVIEFVKNTIHEFITKYDVDGIHFDDYFYPYGSQTINGVSYKFGDMNEDLKTFEENNRSIIDIKDWRRDNVSILIKEISSIISHHNYINAKSVQWGISPFGIYAHKGEEFKDGVKTGNLSNGSNTPYGSLSSYRDIYADTLRWINNNFIDYVIPQIYWTFGKNEAPYEELINFWSEAVKGKRCQLYIGHGNYCVREVKGDKNWNNPYEITNQIKFNSNYDEILGSAFFSIKDLYKRLDFPDKREDVYRKYITLLEREILKYKAIVPSKPWLDSRDTSEVSDLRVLRSDDNKHYLFFKDRISNDSKFYIVYGFESEDKIDLKDSKNILGIYGRDYSKEDQHVIVENLGDNIKLFVVTVQDNSGTESLGVKYIFKI